MSYDNARRRFTNAVGILVDEKARIKDRLLIAYAGELSGVDRNGDLPAPMANEFDGLRYALSDAEMPYGYGAHAAKRIHDMSEDEASALASLIYSMFLRLNDLAQRGPRHPGPTRSAGSY